MTTFACSFPECGRQVPAESASVPAIEAVRQAEGGRAISIADLSRHVLCQEHAAAARGLGRLRMFSLADTTRELERRVAERQKAKTFFARYAAPASLAPGKPQVRQVPVRDGQLAAALMKVGLAPGAKPNGAAVIVMPSPATA